MMRQEQLGKSFFTSWSGRLLSVVLLGSLGTCLAFSNLACVSHRPSSLTVPLELRPTDLPNGAISLPTNPGKVYIAQVIDNRDHKDRIGDNLEEATPVPIYADSNPTEFVRRSISDQLKGDGVNITNNPMEADLTMTVTLNRFWVAESPNYEANIAIAVELKGRGDMSVYNGLATGHDSTFGKSLSVENYQQVLSNAMVNVVAGLVAKPDFQKALSVGPGQMQGGPVGMGGGAVAH